MIKLKYMDQLENQPPQPNTPERQPQPEIPQKSKLPTWIIILITVLVVAVIGIAGYFVYNYYISEEPVTCTEEGKVCPDGSSVGRIAPDCEFAECPEVVDPTADWQTYRNEEYGFEMKYPKNLIIQQPNLNKVTIGSEVMPYIVIQRYPSEQNIDFQSFVQQKLIEDFGGLLKPEEIKWIDWAHKEVFNQHALDVEFENKAGGYTGVVTWTYFSKIDWAYKIAASQGYNDITQKEFQNQILSTFKFID